MVTGALKDALLEREVDKNTFERLGVARLVARAAPIGGTISQPLSEYGQERKRHININNFFR